MFWSVCISQRKETCIITPSIKLPQGYPNRHTNQTYIPLSNCKYCSIIWTNPFIGVNLMTKERWSNNHGMKQFLCTVKCAPKTQLQQNKSLKSSASCECRFNSVQKTQSKCSGSVLNWSQTLEKRLFSTLLATAILNFSGSELLDRTSLFCSQPAKHQSHLPPSSSVLSLWIQQRYYLF